MMNTLRVVIVLSAMGGLVATARAADSPARPPATAAPGDAGVASAAAPASGDAGVASEAAPASGAAAREPEPPKAEGEKEPPPESPLLFPGGIRIGGLFDVSYERVGMNGSPSSGQNAFRNYHHFVFVSRQGDDIPIGFNAEVINQYFYELTARLWRKGSFRLSARAGKIMVPFGPDPLFHKNYGGLSAIDQKLLPVVWSSFGVNLRVDASLKGFSLANDLYFVQGFDVSTRDHALNMQSDLQAYDGARVAVGDRVSISRGPATLWYSLYWNPMRFGRSLLMQAVDLGIWRPAWPVVNRLALGVGVLRALISTDRLLVVAHLRDQLALLAGAQRPHDFQQPQGILLRRGTRQRRRRFTPQPIGGGGICRRPVQPGLLLELREGGRDRQRLPALHGDVCFLGWEPWEGSQTLPRWYAAGKAGGLPTRLGSEAH